MNNEPTDQEINDQKVKDEENIEECIKELEEKIKKDINNEFLDIVFHNEALNATDLSDREDKRKRIKNEGHYKYGEKSEDYLHLRIPRSVKLIIDNLRRARAVINTNSRPESLSEMVRNIIIDEWERTKKQIIEYSKYG